MKNILKILSLFLYLLILLIFFDQIYENKKFLIKLLSSSSSVVFFFIFQVFFIIIITARAFTFFNYFLKINNIYKWIEIYFQSILIGIVIPYSSSAFRIVSLKLLGYPIYKSTSIFFLLFTFVLIINCFFFFIFSFIFKDLYISSFIFIFTLLLFLFVFNFRKMLKFIYNFYFINQIKKLYNVIKNIYNFLNKPNNILDKKISILFFILSIIIFLMEFFSFYILSQLLSKIDPKFIIFFDNGFLIKIFLISFFLDRIPIFNFLPGISELVFASVISIFLDLQFTHSFLVKLLMNLSITFAVLLLVSLAKILNFLKKKRYEYSN